MGQEWAYLSLYQTDGGVKLGMFSGRYEQYDDATEIIASIPATGSGQGEYIYYLKVDINKGGESRFSYSLDGRLYRPLGALFQATKGVWIGAKVGIFSLNPSVNRSAGYADFDWFKVQ